MRFALFVSVLAACCAVATPLFFPNKTQLCFPDGFLLGAATASYQVEGAVNEGNRTPSIWDDFCRKKPQLACANVADDFYHRYVDDIKMMKDAGHNMFRFSISWSRVMNWDAKAKHMKANPAGIKFYHAVIDELNKNGITPVLTMYHWDLPIELETQLDAAAPGWLDPAIQDHFVEYATLLYKEYGAKVNYWTTFNEPLTFALMGYSGDLFGMAHAPGLNASEENQYIVAHNVLLSHAKAVQKFREMKAKQVIGNEALISIVIVGGQNRPRNPSRAADVAAAERAAQFQMGWFLEPIVSGDYPAVMRERARDWLPVFTPQESALLKGSYDIFMLNHYSTNLVVDCHSGNSTISCDKLPLGWMHDLGVDGFGKPEGARNSSVDKDGNQLCPFFSAVPEGYREIINWVSAHNKTTPILLTENGFCGNDEIDNQDQLWYHQTYLEQVHKAITEDQVPVIGYTAWSLMDNYEWGSFKPRYGLYYVNYTSQVGSKDDWTPKSTDLARVPRTAAKWFASVAQTGCMTPWMKGEKVKAIVPAVSIRPAKIVLPNVTQPTLPVETISPKGTDSTSRAARTFNLVVDFVLLFAFFIVIGILARNRRHAGTAREQSPLLGETA